jgi:hypothetical protein
MQEQVFSGCEKKYTFNIYDYINVKRDICNHGETLKDLTGAFTSFNGLPKNKDNVEQ